MKILSEVSLPYPIDSIREPLGISHNWIFDAKMPDFRLSEMEFVEETIGPTIELSIDNAQIFLPASWSFMAVDKENYVIDFIPVSLLAVHDHDILLFCPDDSKGTYTHARVIDLHQTMAVTHPMVDKGTALALPVRLGLSHGRSLHYSIIAGPNDLHRWINHLTIGDILG